MISSSNNYFLRPKKKRAAADKAKAQFHQEQGDHLTLLRLYNSFITCWQTQKLNYIGDKNCV
jgi:hypothetical protein